MPSRPRLTPRLQTVFKACMALLGLLSVVIILLVAGEIYSVRSLRAYSGRFFELQGDRYVAVHPAMIPGSFGRTKRPGEFRVFALGGSAMMGTPYVHQMYDRISTLFNLLAAPNEGGIPTWLAAFLKAAMKTRGREVSVVNAAMGGLDLAYVLAAAKEIVEVGEPDALVVMSGNNERAGPLFSGYDLKDRRTFPQAMKDLTAAYSKNMAELAKLAKERNVDLYVLTVPVNIRDWKPADIVDFDEAKASELSNAGRCRDILRLPAASGMENSLQAYLAAKCWDAGDRPDIARPLYLKARDLDKSFKRARSGWNAVVRGLKGPRVHVLDMERIVEEYAADGLPGSDLFLDECHFRLEGNRMAGFEIGRAIALDQGIPPTLFDGLRDLDIRIWTPRQLTALYILKIVKWQRLKWFSLARRVRGDENIKTLIRNYEQAYEDHQAVDWVMKLQLKSAYRHLAGRDRVDKRPRDASAAPRRGGSSSP
ncbi:MAG: hypothetical protein WC943_02665 [Elusimicrobiota bacterium]|jgi:hypothetical protein